MPPPEAFPNAAPPPGDLPRVDPTSLDYWHDTHRVLAPLRERWPVVRSTAGDFEVLRYEHVESGLRDPQMRPAFMRPAVRARGRCGAHRPPR